MIEYKQGDIFNDIDQHQIIAHGVNCLGVMGSGVALQIAKRYRFTFEQYQELCRSKRPEELIGTAQLVDESKRLTIANCFTQLKFGYNGRFVSYDAVESSLKKVRDHMANKGIKSIAMPKIGAGLGGGDWVTIENIINDVFTNVDVKVYYL